MRYKLSIILIAFALFSCKDNFGDKNKRNENWVWWTDAKTGKSKWIPVNGDGLPVTDGKYTRFYFNGNMFEKGRLVNGQNVDTIFNYDINGTLQEYRTFSKDSDEYFVKNGPIKMYYARGSIKAIGDVKNHTYGDKWTSYFENGKPLYTRNSKNNIGWAVEYYDNGHIRDSDYIDNGEEYLTKRYYFTGQLAKSIGFSHHNYNGVQKEYYINGRQKAICPVINGLSNGKLVRWYENGHLKEISYKKDNRLNGGPDSVFYENGKLRLTGYMKNDQFDGEIKQYDETGKLIKDDIVKEGVRIENKLMPHLIH